MKFLPTLQTSQRLIAAVGRRAIMGCLGLVAFCGACLFTAAAQAQYQRHIESLLPRAGQRGTTVDIVLQGLHLENPREVLFYRPGIRAIELETLPDLTQFDEKGKLNPIDRRIGGRNFGAQVKQQVRAKLVIAPDCPIGLHPLKLRTASQLTTLSTFWVTPFAVQRESEAVEGQHTNDSPSGAELIQAENATVLGYIIPGPTMDRDVFRIHRNKGERISVEVNSVRLSPIWWAREELDLMVRVLDAQGNELAQADDSARFVQDPLLSIVAPHAGDYFVEIQQSLFSRSYNSFYQHYAAHIGTFAQSQAVYPAGGPPDRALQATLIGDPLGDKPAQITLTAGNNGDFAYDYGAPSPISMRVTSHRNVLEANSAFTEAGELPAALNGIISKPNEADEFRIMAKKGTSYRLRVYARSLGTPLDPAIEIRHQESGQIEASADDVANYDERGLPGVPFSFRRLEIMDPSILWTAKHDGAYLLRIQDAQNDGGPSCVYRIEAEPVENRVNTYIYSRNYARESISDTGLAIPQGSRWTLRFGLSPGQGNAYRGDLQLVAEGLPAGVQMIAPRIHAEGGNYPTNVPVQFTATAGTPPQTALIRVLAHPVEQGVAFQSRGGQSFLFVGDHFGQASNSLILDQYALAVTDKAPFSVEVETPRIPLIQNGELTLKIKLHRAPGFDQPLLVGAIWAPPEVGFEPALEVAPGVSEINYRFTASATAPPADWRLAIQAYTLPTNPKDVAGSGQIRVSSELFNLTVAKPYVALASEPQAIRRGARLPFTWKVNHLGPFQADASAKLLGLPTGVRSVDPAPLLKPQAESLTFQLEADQEALLGQYKGIGVELTFREGGQEIRQRTGAGVLRVDPPLTK